MNAIAQPNDALGQLKSVQRTALGASLLALVVALFYWPTLPVIGGLAAGSVLGLLNFHFLTRVILKLTATDNEAELQTGKWGFFFFLKMVVLVFVAGFLILAVQVNPLAFVAGFSTIVVGIVWQGLRSFI